ncbi:anti-sigma factor domain-containing protein [Cohnella sp. GCM10027633]|uniref:anti-sigma factor domain-containing protein n=1 Tax=unclassified Cohnella TaxID=2636738 RepID=UPI00364076FD
MSQGTIMALENKSAIVLTPGGEFVRVPRKPEFELGAEITYHLKRTAFAMRRWMQASAGAAALLLILAGFWLLRPPEVVAYVTMDVNPSVEIGLDANMKVRELRAVNADADAIIAGVKYKGRELEPVMQALADNLIRTHLLVPAESEIVIASVPLKAVETDWEITVSEKIKAILNAAAKTDGAQADASLDVTTVSVPKEVRNAANEQGVSSGKMAFWLAAESQGHEVPLDTLKKQSLKKIASEWEGDVKKVLGNDKSAEDRDAAKAQWKALLDEAKAKKKLQQAASKPSKEPASAPSPSATAGIKTPGKNDNGGGKNNNDGKRDDDDKRGNDGKRDDDDKRGNDGKRGNDDKRDDGDKRGNDDKRGDDDKRGNDDKRDDDKRGDDDKRDNDDKRGDDDKSANVVIRDNGGKGGRDDRPDDERRNEDRGGKRSEDRGGNGRDDGNGRNGGSRGGRDD